MEDYISNTPNADNTHNAYNAHNAHNIHNTHNSHNSHNTHNSHNPHNGHNAMKSRDGKSVGTMLEEGGSNVTPRSVASRNQSREYKKNP